MSLAAVPPLKVTRQYDLQTPIAAWLDEDDAVYGTVATVTGGGPHHPPKPHFRSMEVSQDLAKLQRLRSSIVDVLTSRKYDEAAGQLDTFYEYHASLLQCEQHGICVDEVSSPLELAWASAFATGRRVPPAAAARARPGDDDDDDDAMDIDNYPNHRGGRNPRGGDNGSAGMEVHASITWERVNILWNIVALEAYLASTQPLTTRQGWMKAAVHLEKGAGILRHLRQDVLLSGSSQTSPFAAIDLSVAFCQSWESLLTAEAQRSSYEAFRCAARPRHFMLAKLATAAAPLYADCDQSCGHEELTRLSDNQNSAAANPMVLRQFLHSWKTYARAWGVWMRTKAEHHQACVHRDKRQLGLELARLHKALTLGGQCQELCQQQHQEQQQQIAQHSAQQQPLSLEGLAHEAKQTVDEMQGRYVQATQEQAQAAADNANNNNNSHVTVQPEDLPEIAPQLQVKVNQPIEKILPPLETPLFEDIMNPLVRRYVDLFMSEMEKLLYQMTSIAEEKTESARKALATVNLPHSLTAYRQEQAGGGIPEDLWYRVEAVQREKRVARLKQELWELRDIADAARHTYKVIKHQLEEDLAMDQLFREQHPNFEGHDAGEVQKTFRQSLENYDRLLVTAQDGDAVLLRRLEMLDTDPKYKLLQFQKSQLDRLLPGAGMVGPAIDTSLLSKLLVELSVLFREREMILSTMREELKNFDIHSRLSEVDLSGAAGGGASANNNNPNNAGGPNAGSNAEAEREFRRILIESKESFNEIAYDIQENINKQTELVQTILVQNQKFMDARDAMQSSSSSDSCIVMIEDAIEEIEQLSKHLKEGKDFYDVVIPKLDKLKLQVGDVSARLTVERCEYEDNCRRNEQEAEDARMAASFAGNSGGGSGEGNDGSAQNNGGQDGPRRGSDTPRAQAQPGVEQVSHGVPQVRVDDEKVASLVAMDFDPEKVVEALKKYDNNVEQALNELLSC